MKRCAAIVLTAVFLLGTAMQCMASGIDTMMPKGTGGAPGYGPVTAVPGSAQG